MSKRVKQRGAGVGCWLAFPRAAQGRERALQSQTLGHLVLPRRRRERRPSPRRPIPRRHFARCLTVTNPLSRTTNYTYCAQGRQLTATAPNGGATKNTYDLDGNLLSLTDPDNNTTTYSYNAVNEQVGEKRDIQDCVGKRDG